MARDVADAPRTALQSAVSAITEVVVVVRWRWCCRWSSRRSSCRRSSSPRGRWRTPCSIGDRVLVSKLTPGAFHAAPRRRRRLQGPGRLARRRAATRPQEGAVRRHRPGRPDVRRPAAAGRRRAPHQARHRSARRHGACCDAAGPRRGQRRPDRREPYLVPGQRRAVGQPFDVTVPAGYLWVMGDNRPVSADSRLHRPSTTAWCRCTTSSARRSSSCGRSTGPAASAGRTRCSRDVPRRPRRRDRRRHADDAAARPDDGRAAGAKVRASARRAASRPCARSAGCCATGTPSSPGWTRSAAARWPVR